MYQSHKLEGRAYLQEIIYGGLLYVQKENTQIAKLTPEIEKTDNSWKKKVQRTYKTLFNFISNQRNCASKMAKTLSVIVFSAKSNYSLSKMGGLTTTGGNIAQYNW